MSAAPPPRRDGAALRIGPCSSPDKKGTREHTRAPHVGPPTRHGWRTDLLRPPRVQGRRAVRLATEEDTRGCRPGRAHRRRPGKARPHGGCGGGAALTTSSGRARGRRTACRGGLPLLRCCSPPQPGPCLCVPRSTSSRCREDPLTSRIKPWYAPSPANSSVCGGAKTDQTPFAATTSLTRASGLPSRADTRGPPLPV